MATIVIILSEINLCEDWRPTRTSSLCITEHWVWLQNECASHMRWTRNLSVDEIGESYRLNHAIFVKLHHPYTQLPHNVRLSHRRIATSSAQWGASWVFYYYYCAL